MSDLAKLNSFTFNYTGQPDKLYEVMTAAEIKAAFDSRGEELRISINAIIDSFKSVDGAKNIGITSITGLTATNMQELIAALKTYVDTNFTSTGNIYTKAQIDTILQNIILGQVPSGSITDDMLSNAAGQIKSSMVDIVTQLSNYNFDVVTSDANGKPTHTTYKRIDNTLYKDVTCSNADTNGFYQTVVEKTYGTDGTTLKQTTTYTFTYNTDGVIQSKRWVVS